MSSQKYAGLFYSDFDPNMKVASSEKELLKKMKDKRSLKKKRADSATSINMKKDAARKASDLNIGVVSYDK
jgi:hypothetical protein